MNSRLAQSGLHGPPKELLSISIPHLDVAGSANQDEPSGVILDARQPMQDFSFSPNHSHVHIAIPEEWPTAGGNIATS
jgi:hypothetical protein